MDRDAESISETPEPKAATLPSEMPQAARNGPRQGRARMVSERSGPVGSRPAESPRSRTGPPDLADRPRRPERTGAADRPERFERPAQGSQAERTDRAGVAERPGRTDRPARSGPPGRNESTGRTDRPAPSGPRPGTPFRPAVPPRPASAPPTNPPRSPIVERPGAWSARRPENPAPRPGNRPMQTPSASGSGDQTRQPEPTIGSSQPVSPPGHRETAPAASATHGRFETVGGQRFSEVRRTFTSERPASEAAAARRPVRRPAPQRPRRDDSSAGPRPTGNRDRPVRRDSNAGPAGAAPGWQGPSDRPPRDGAPRGPRRAGPPTGPPRDGGSAGPRRDGPPSGPRRPDAPSGPGSRLDRSRPTGGADGPRDRRRTDDRKTDNRGSDEHRADERRSDERRPRPTSWPEAERRPAADRGPRLLTQRRTARPDPMGGSGRKLETVGRASRKVESDNPDEAPSRIKRRSPHSHSHRGAKPKPVAPKINTSKAKSVKKSLGKGNKRGNRR